MGISAAKQQVIRPKPVKPVKPSVAQKPVQIAKSKAIILSKSANRPGTSPAASRANPARSSIASGVTKPAPARSVVAKTGNKPSAAAVRGKASASQKPHPVKTLGGVKKGVTSIQEGPIAVRPSRPVVDKKPVVSKAQGGYYGKAVDIYGQVSSGNGANFLSRKYAQEPFAWVGDKVANNINWVGSTVAGVGNTLNHGLVTLQDKLVGQSY